MKNRKHLYLVDCDQGQKVFRVDDEIEVVVQDVDVKDKRSSPKKQLQRSVKDFCHPSPKSFNSVDPKVVNDTKENLSDFDVQEKVDWDILSPKKHQSSLGSPRRSKVLCAQKLINGSTHVVKSLGDMTDSNEKTEMTPSNEVIVFDSDEGVSFTDKKTVSDNSDANSPQSNVCSPKRSEVNEHGEHSPGSVVEIPILKKEVPIITLEENVQLNGSCSQVCDAASSNQSKDCSLISEENSEVPVETVRSENAPKGVKRKTRSELDQLYVSLKEIPWAQSWSPKTFLTRNAKRTFPKRDRIIMKRDKDKSVNNKPVFVSSKSSLSKVKHKDVVTSLTGKIKSKVKGAVSVLKEETTECDKKFKTENIALKSDGFHSESSASNTKPDVTKKSKNIFIKGVKTNEKALSIVSTTTSPLPSGKSGPVHKLSTNLAIKQYDASKMCKSKISPKRKVGAQYGLNGNCGVSGQCSATSSMPNKMSAVKVGHFYGKNSSVSPSAQTGAPNAPKTKASLEDSKPLAAISPKILPYSSTPECNGVPTVRLEALHNKATGGSSVGSSESRLGNEQLLQKQLVSVLGKEPLEVKKRKLEDESLRYSVRQSECAFRYKEIAVKKHSNYIQIILVPNRTRHNGLTLEALHELREALISAKKDPTCKILLLNSSGSIFCSGVDLASLTGHIHMPHKISQAIRSLIETLALFSKPVVAAVNGAAVGLGVTLLTYCDVVFASEKATFFTPYARLGHIPEGAMTLVLPQVVGSLVASDMLLRDRKLTAFQASIYGLVSEVIWPSQFMESVIPRVQAMANQSGQAMESTKVLLRYHQWDKLQSTLENESRLLPKQWLSPSCQQAIKQALEQPGGLIDW